MGGTISFLKSSPPVRFLEGVRALAAVLQRFAQALRSKQPLVGAMQSL